MAVVGMTVRARFDVVGRDVDDVATAVRDHDRRNRSAEEERSLRVGAEHPVEVAGRDVPVVARSRRHDLARIVDQDVDRSVLGERCVDDSAHVRSVRDIAEVGGCADRTGGLEDRLVPIGDDDRALFGDETFRERAAQCHELPR